MRSTTAKRGRNKFPEPVSEPGCDYKANIKQKRPRENSTLGSCDKWGFLVLLIPMEVHLTLEQQAQLAQIATKAGTAPERLVTNVVARYLNEEARFLAAVEKGIAAAERGEFIEEAEMDARLEAMFKT